MSNWHYYRNGQQIGPVALTELKEAIEHGYVDEDTLVWQPGMMKWVKIRKHPYLVSSILTPPPPLVSTQGAARLLKQVAASIFDTARGIRSQ